MRFVLALLLTLAAVPSSRAFLPEHEALQGIPWSGRVVHALTGEPVSGAEIAARAARVAGTAADRGGDPGPELAESPLVGTARTRADGGFALASSSAGSLTVSAPGFLGGFVDLPSDRDRQLGTIVLEPATVVTGRLLDGSGPLADVRVGLIDRRGADADNRFTTTASNGTFTLDAGATETRRLLAVAGRGAVLELERLPDRLFNVGEIRLPERHVVRGSVVHADGSAAAGARVAAGAYALATPHYRNGGSLTWIEAVTDGAGGFELRLPSGAYVLRLQARGLFAESTRVEVAGADVQLPSYRLAPIAQISGTVIDELGRPVQDVTVTLPPPLIEQVPDGRWPSITGFHSEPPPVGIYAPRQSGWHQGEYQLPDTSTDAAGRYRLAVPTSLPDPVLHFAKPGHISLDEGVLPRSPYGIGRRLDLGVTEQAPVQLPAATGVFGTVVDGSGAPIAGAWIQATATIWELDRELRSLVVTTSATGRFELAGLYPGEWSVRASGRELETTTHPPMSVTAGSEVPITVTMRRLAPPGSGHPVDARVEDPQGRPLSRIELSLEALEVEGVPVRFRFRTTGAEGRVRFDNVAPGRYLLGGIGDFARSGDRNAGEWVEIDVGPGLDTTLLHLPPRLDARRTVEGRVIDRAGRPVAGARVVLRERRADGRRDPISGGVSTSDGAGRFRFEHVPAGLHSLSASRSRFATKHRDFEIGDTGSDPGTITMTLEPGATVEGVLRGLSAEEIEGATISTERAFADRSGPPLIRDDGSYRISNLGIGEWIVHAETRSGRIVTATIDVGAGMDIIDLPLGFPPGPTMSGRVTYNGRPAAGVRLEMRGSQRGTPTRRVRTGRDGSYLVPGLLPDQYEVFLYDLSGYVDVVRIAEDLTLAFDLRGARLSGQIVDASTGEGVAGGSLEVEPVPGGIAAAYHSGNEPHLSADGRFRIGPLTADRWRLRASAPGYATGFVTVELDDEDIDDLEIRLEPTAGLGLNITNAVDRQPRTSQSSESVYLSWQTADGELSVTHRVIWRPVIATRWNRIPSGPGILTVYRPRVDLAARLLIDNRGEPIDVELAPAGSVRVTVAGLTDDPGARLVILDPNDIAVAGWGTPGGAFDGDGIWIRRGRRTVMLPPGTYQAVVNASDGRQWRGGFSIIPGVTSRITLR